MRTTFILVYNHFI